MRALLQRFLIVGCLASGTVAPQVTWAQWSGKASPHDGQHLLVIRPTDWLSTSAKASVSTPVPACAFGAEAAIKESLESPVTVRHAGEYAIWIHLSGPDKQPIALHYELIHDGKAVVQGDLSGESPAAGGPAGFATYYKEAMKSAPGAKLERKAEGDSKASNDDTSEFEQEVLTDLARAEGRTIERNWAQFARLENPQGERPYYWWKLAAAKLEPGVYQLKLTPPKGLKARDVLATDAAFLTTSKELKYPFRGDIDAVPASYIRFRIDDMPPKGVSINATIRVHYDPWSVGGGVLSPNGMPKGSPHTEPGLTKWYRLQDIERAPGFGPGEGHLLLGIQPVEGNKPVRGATQFAVYPHDDYVLREIDWNEPEGTRISMAMDFATYLHQLRTFRDHGREDYERALAATGGSMQPLTRGPLYFGNAWGSANGDDALYMVKALRLLGFNCVADVSAPVLNRKLYGWSSHTGEYWPPAFMPYDDDEAKQKYADYYAHHFDKQRELFEDVSIFQVADEPGEISLTEMSSPLWKFRGNGESFKFVDLAGNGTLATRKVDFESGVLEADVEKHGGAIGFRVATDHATEPTRYVEWQIGMVSPSMDHNLAIERVGLSAPGRQAMARAGAAVASTGTKVKIVFERGAAELYLNGKRIQAQTDLPLRGGFAIAGPQKAVSALRLREVRKDEHITSRKLDDQTAGNETDTLDDAADLADLASDKQSPAWSLEKPLRKAIEEDFAVGGGMPEAHAGFRRWVAAQGVKPELFGHKSWDNVRMLTIAAAVETPEEARLFYWSRKYSGYLTPRMFALASQAIQDAAPNKKMLGFVALSGHALNFPSAMPLDMFQLGAGSPAMMPGVSDWMSLGGWRWDSHQSVAYSVAMYNAGARRYGEDPLSFPMMHCVWPMEFRALTMLANQCRYISYYNYGPCQQVTEGYWSNSPECHVAVHKTNNRAAQVDDILGHATARPSRVALLYSISNEYWNAQSSFADKRTTFLGLSHEYYQPELVTENQVEAGTLSHYDALYVVDPLVATATQSKIAEWVKQGGLLWTCADAAERNEFNEPLDLVASLAGIRRTSVVEQSDNGPTEVIESTIDPKAKAIVKKKAVAAAPLTVSPVKGQSTFRPHTVVANGVPAKIESVKASVRARYDDQRPAWLEQPVGKGKVVYIGHRAGLTYTSKALHPGGIHTIWSDTGRALLTAPLHEAKVERELVVSEPVVMAAPMSSGDATVVILYNMRPVPLESVQVSLRESQRPHSVQYFENDRLVDLPFEYADGRVTATLPALDGGQMIAVRRSAPPADPRLDEMLARTREQLDAADYRAISCGAWTAGFYPAWKLADRLVPLLEHPHWEVRRTAAESLGRLKYAPAGKALLASMGTERDAHALGDKVVALAAIGNDQAGVAALQVMRHRDAFVRQQAVRAAAALFAVGGPDAAKRLTWVRQICDEGLQDTDLRVRSEAILLAAKSNPELAVKHLTPVAGKALPADERARWVAAIVASETAWQEFVKQKLPGGDDVTIAAGQQRQNQQLVAPLLKQVEAAKTISPALFWAVTTQRDTRLTQAVFQHRDKLEAAIAGYLPVLLERTTDARLGHDLAAWEQYLKQVRTGERAANRQ